MEDIEQKKRSEELGKDLKSIYSDPDGRLPDFTRLDGKPGGRLRSVIVGTVAALAVLGAATWAGLLLFSRTSGFTGDGVELTLTTQPFTAGAENDVVLRYRNGERIPLARTDIELRVPAGFEVTGAEPVSAEEGRWSVGSVAPGAEGEVRVRGYVRTALDAAMTFEARLNYRPADFNADFQKVASHTAVVTGSALTLEGTAPEKTTPGDEVAFTYGYANVSELPLEGARVEIDPPEGFIFASSEPKTDEGVALRWTLPTLDAGASGTITVKGTFSATSRGPKSLPARIGFAKDADVAPLALAEARTEVQKSAIDLALLVNGSDKPPTVSAGDQLFFTLRYENAGDVALKDVSLEADLASVDGVLDWVSLRDELAGTRTGTKIAWTKKELPALESLAPGGKGEIDFSVQLAKKLPAKVPADAVRAAASAKIPKAGKTPARQIDAVPLAVRLLSDAAFLAYGRYYVDGVPVGAGPLPPASGETTTYRIFWTVRNSLHELTDMSVTTLLPQGVKWTGARREASAGSIDFDSSGRKATWRLNRLPTSVTEITASFDVEVTPGAEDIGEILDLTGDSRFEALDKDVGAVILKTQPPVGTDLIGDEDAAGKGVVAG